MTSQWFETRLQLGDSSRRQTQTKGTSARRRTWHFHVLSHRFYFTSKWVAGKTKKGARGEQKGSGTFVFTTVRKPPLYSVNPPYSPRGTFPVTFGLAALLQDNTCSFNMRFKAPQRTCLTPDKFKKNVRQPLESDKTQPNYLTRTKSSQRSWHDKVTSASNYCTTLRVLNSLKVFQRTSIYSQLHWWYLPNLTESL